MDFYVRQALIRRERVDRTGARGAHGIARGDQDPQGLLDSVVQLGSAQLLLPLGHVWTDVLPRRGAMVRESSSSRARHRDTVCRGECHGLGKVWR